MPVVKSNRVSPQIVGPMIDFEKGALIFFFWQTYMLGELICSVLKIVWGPNFYSVLKRPKEAAASWIMAREARTGVDIRQALKFEMK